jgi:hypothetical protein
MTEKIKVKDVPITKTRATLDGITHTIASRDNITKPLKNKKGKK